MYTDNSHPEVQRGIKAWRNPKNQFNVVMLHYTADPNKDPEMDGGKWLENEKRGVPKASWLKEYEIDFTTKAGKLIFGKEFCDFDPNIHFVESFEVDDCEFLLSLDFGQRNPTAALVGAWTRDGRLYIIDEYYNPALPSVSSREMFKQFEYLLGEMDGKTLRMKRDMARDAFQLMIIDPSTTAKNRGKIRDGEEVQYSVIEDFYDNGWEFEPGTNDVDTGITRLREYFQVDSENKSHIYIFRDKCPELCNELQKYRYKEYSDNQDRQQNKSEVPVKKDDHAVDALRYMIMTRPHNPELAPKPKTKIQEDIERLLKPVAYGIGWDNDSPLM